MFLSKQKNGFFYIVYERPDGKRGVKSTKEKTKAKATKKLFEFQKKLEKERAQIVKPIRLYQFAFNYMRYAEPYLSEKTQLTYRTTFKFVFNYFGNIWLTEISHIELEKYLHQRLIKRSVFAARKDHSNLSAAFNKAIDDGYLLSNPCSKIKRFKLPERQPLFYSKEEYDLLLKHIEDNDIKDLVIVAVNTGMRQGELVALEWSQVNFEEHSILLDNRNHITKTKRIRYIPLNDTSFKTIKDRYDKRDFENSRIFTQYGEAIDADKLSRFFKKYVLKSKVNPKLNFHSLRHTFASWLVQKGVSIYVISRLLGHSDIKTTQIYAHLRRDDLKSATVILDTLTAK